MPAPYSYDLRKKAIEAWQSGERKTQVCRLLKISRNTLDTWLKQKEETGDFQAKSPVNKGTKPKITDETKFRQFIKEHQDKIQKQLAQLWGEGVTQQNISYACQKWGITRKKKLTAIKKEMKKNELTLMKNSQK